MANTNWTAVAGIGTLVVLILVVGSLYFPGLLSTQEVDADGDAIPSGVGGSVTVDTTTEVTYNYDDKDSLDLANDPGAVMRFISPLTGNVSDDATKTLPKASEIKGIAGYDSTTYYAKEVNFNSGNSAQLYAPKPLLDKAGTLTVTFRNSDDQQPNSASDTQALGASEEVEVMMRLDTASRTRWGVEGGENVCIFQYNKTGISKIEGDLGVAGTPNDFNFNASTTVFNGKSAIVVPSVVSGEEVEIPITITTTATELTLGTILANCYDANVDIDESTNQVIVGIEDEDFNLKSLNPVNASIHVA